MVKYQGMKIKKSIHSHLSTKVTMVNIESIQHVAVILDVIKWIVYLSTFFMEVHYY